LNNFEQQIEHEQPKQTPIIKATNRKSINMK
jgi:hypothetical protein